MATGNSSPDIDERTLERACQMILFVRTIRPEPGSRIIIEQMVDAAGSVGANRQEASGGSTRTEFRRFNEIALRSAKEAVFWLRVCDRTDMGEASRRVPLLDEAIQIRRILTAIVLSTKRGQR